MQVKIDDKVLYEIDDVDFGLIADYVMNPMPDIERRLHWVIDHLCEQIYVEFHKKWLAEFAKDPSIINIPVKKEDFCRMVFNHPLYKNRAQREAETLNNG